MTYVPGWGLQGLRGVRIEEENWAFKFFLVATPPSRRTSSPLSQASNKQRCHHCSTD